MRLLAACLKRLLNRKPSTTNYCTETFGRQTRAAQIRLDLFGLDDLILSSLDRIRFDLSTTHVFV